MPLGRPVHAPLRFEQLYHLIARQNKARAVALQKTCRGSDNQPSDRAGGGKGSVRMMRSISTSESAWAGTSVTDGCCPARRSAELKAMRNTGWRPPAEETSNKPPNRADKLENCTDGCPGSLIDALGARDDHSLKGQFEDAEGDLQPKWRED